MGDYGGMAGVFCFAVGRTSVPLSAIYPHF